MAKGVIKNYSFSKSAKTVTLTDITTVRLDKLFLITDVTTNAILYNFADSAVTASVATNVITLSTASGASGDSDKLQIIYDVESSDSAAFADITTPISAASLPLPSGAATSAKQDTGNTSLSSIDTKTPTLGQALAASSVPVILPSATITTLTPPAAITGFATSAKQDTGNTSLTSIDGKITAVNTGAVVISSGSVTANAGTNLNTSALALDTSVNGVLVAQNSTTSGQSGPLAQTATTTAAPTYTTAKTNPLSTQTDGSLRTAVTNTVTVGSHAVTNAGTFATQSAITAASGSIASGAFASGSIASGAVVDGAMVTLGAKADAKNSATDTTAITAMQVLKQISYQLQQEQPVIIDKFSHYEDTLSANTVKTVDIDTSGYTAVYEVEITNKSSGGTIFFSIGTSSASPTDPASTTGSTQVGGFLPAAITSITLPNNTVAASLRVKLLSATASQPFCVTVRGH